ncbi:MAG: DUF4410 domain-containing protein [Verrucomicrobiae bacterium]
MIRIVPVFLLAVLSVVFSGCASVSVKKSVVHPGSKPPVTPDAIYVRPFVLPPHVLRVDRKGAALDNFAAEFQAAFAETLALRLGKNIAPARAIGSAEAVPRSNVWVVEGEFQRINQGSRALRSIVGCGLGGTKMECIARVYDLRQGRKEPFVMIETTGGSNAEPGAIFSGPFGAVPRLLMTSVISGVTPDSRRTARMIAATLSEYLAAAHAPLPSKPMRVKRLGEIPGFISKRPAGG